MRWVVAFTACGIVMAGCAAAENEPPVPRDDLLPSIEDLPRGSEIDVLEGEEQLVLSVALDAINSGDPLRNARPIRHRNARRTRRTRTRLVYR